MGKVAEIDKIANHSFHASPNIRLVQVLYSLILGGSEILGKEIALGLDGQGFRTAVCALEKGGELESLLLNADIPVFVAARKPSEYFSVMLRMYRYFRKFKPHIVHTHHLYQLVYSVLGAKLVGAKIVHTEHEYFSLLSRKARFMLRVLSLFCARITSVGEEITAYLQDSIEIRPDLLVTIPNGVDSEKYSPLVPSAPEISRFASGRHVIGTVSRLETEKRHTVLLHAFHKIQTANPETALVLVGDGSLRKELESESVSLMLDDKVRFLGRRHDIPALLSAMDIFVMSSAKEGLPIALLEAMSMARPIIATSVGDIPRVIEHNRTGILVEPEDPCSLAEQILRLLNEPEYAKSLGKAARRLVVGNYELKQTLSKYRALYQSIL